MKLPQRIPLQPRLCSLIFHRNILMLVFYVGYDYNIEEVVIVNGYSDQYDMSRMIVFGWHFY